MIVNEEIVGVTNQVKQDVTKKINARLSPFFESKVQERDQKNEEKQRHVDCSSNNASSNNDCANNNYGENDNSDNSHNSINSNNSDIFVGSSVDNNNKVDSNNRNNTSTLTTTRCRCCCHRCVGHVTHSADNVISISSLTLIFILLFSKRLIRAID